MPKEHFDLGNVIRSIKRMPTIPTIFTRVSELARDPNSSVRDIAKVIEEDPAIAGKVIKVVNSAAFGLKNPAASLSIACSALGIRFIRNVVLQTSLLQNFAYLQRQGFDVEGIWKHSSMTAVVCRNLATKKRSFIDLNPDEAYTCGLLHDIGDIVLMDNFAMPFLQVDALIQEKNISKEEAETQIFGYTHSQVGAAIAQRWRFPEPVVFGIRWHHGVPRSSEHEAACLLVETAHNLVKAMEVGQILEPDMQTAARLKEKLGITPEDLVGEFQQAMSLSME